MGSVSSSLSSRDQENLTDLIGAGLTTVVDSDFPSFWTRTELPSQVPPKQGEVDQRLEIGRRECRGRIVDFTGTTRMALPSDGYVGRVRRGIKRVRTELAMTYRRHDSTPIEERPSTVSGIRPSYRTRKQRGSWLAWACKCSCSALASSFPLLG